MNRAVKYYAALKETAKIYLEDKSTVFGIFEQPTNYDNNQWTFIQNNFSSKYLETKDHKVIINGNEIVKILEQKNPIELMVEVRDDQLKNKIANERVLLCKAYDKTSSFYNGEINGIEIKIPRDASFHPEYPKEEEFELPSIILTPKSKFIEAITERINIDYR